MPIDIYKEQLLTLTEAANVLPQLNRRRLSSNCIWRWCRRGLRGVQLDYVRIGGRIVTSTEALNRFANALAEADRKLDAETQAKRDEAMALTPNAYRPVRRSRQRRSTTAWEARRREEIRQAEEELKRAGV